MDLLEKSNNGDLEAFKELVGDDIHYSYLSWAADKGHLEIVKYIVEKGVDIHAGNDLALNMAAENGHLEIVKYLVEHGADIHAVNNTTITCASHFNHLEVVKYLVEKGVYICADDNYILRWVVHNGVHEVVRYLKSIYSKRYGERFLCHNCLVLPMCTELCKSEIVEEI